MRRAVFLDRDGVLNRALVREGKPYPPRTLAELEILPGVGEACENLRNAGFRLIAVTNQPDIARGAATANAVAEINERLRRELRLDDVKVCPHDDSAHCLCRKPKPGMLLSAATEWKLDLSGSFLVGDRWRDIEAGHRAGCRTIFVDGGYLETRPESCDREVHSLSEAAAWILETVEQEKRCHV